MLLLTIRFYSEITAMLVALEKKELRCERLNHGRYHFCGRARAVGKNREN